MASLEHVTCLNKLLLNTARELKTHERGLNEFREVICSSFEIALFDFLSPVTCGADTAVVENGVPSVERYVLALLS